MTPRIVKHDPSMVVEQPDNMAHRPFSENHLSFHRRAIPKRAYKGDFSVFTVRCHEHDETPRLQPPPIFLLAQLEEARQAYALLQTPRTIPLFAKTSDRKEWGAVMFGVIYKREGDSLFFQAPDKPTKVAIKVLNKRLVHKYLSKGGSEDPYNDVARMLKIGDDVHVLKCIEFLEDDNNLYIITRAACEHGTLMDYIRRNDLAEDEARRIFLKILKILEYLQKHHVCHHDFKPDNLLFLTPDNLVAFDLAMSIRLRVNPETMQHDPITSRGRSGTHAWMSPEAFLRDQQYDGFALDRYAAGVTLFNLLSKRMLFRLPHPIDPWFRCFISSEYLWTMESTPDALVDSAWDPGFLLEMQHLICRLEAPVRALLKGLVHAEPNQRISLAQAIESEWVRGHQL